jgi:hypothetical protein
MTHDELLSLINKAGAEAFQSESKPWIALQAIVELHKPGGYEYFEKDICEHCTLDIDYYVFYPCPTIEIIEKELS